MRTCERCEGVGHVAQLTVPSTIPVEKFLCPACKGSGVTAAPRSEGPKHLELKGSFEDAEDGPQEMYTDIWETQEGLWIDGVLLDADAERQLYELLKLRHEQGPPVEAKP